jgi:D-3-phosphoglycerate dehydrogenase
VATQFSFEKDKIRILLLEGIHGAAVERLAREGYSNVRHEPKALPHEELLAAVADVQMIGLRSRTQLKGDVLAAAKKLIAVGAFCIGTNQIDLEQARRRGIPVFNAPHANTRSVAEMVLAEMVMLERGLGDKNTAAHQGRWTKSATKSYELRGKKLGIVGYGHIGSQVSVLAEAFGLNVFFHDILPKLPLGNATAAASLDEMLSEVDILSLHVPDTPQTRGLMSHERIFAMKRGAHLINASRGMVVDIDALATAITGGHLGGAAIDVFPKEPKSNDERFDSPLCGLPNVILTPHIGGSTQEAQHTIGLEVASKLAQYSDTGSTVASVNFPNINLPAHEDGHRLLHIHENRPGVLAAINSILHDSEANVMGQYLQTLDGVGYVVIDVDRAGDKLKPALSGIAGTIRCRVLY